MSGIVESIKKTDDADVKSALSDILKWGKLRHTKADLETMLAFNIVELRFKQKKDDKYVVLTVTGNTRFIDVYKTAKKKDKAAKLNSPFIGMHTKDRHTVTAYDLADGRIKTIPLDSWQVVDFMPLREENVLKLDMLVNELLKK